MRIGSEYRIAAVTGHHWAVFAQQNHLDAARVIARIDELAERLPAAFRTVADDADVGVLRSELPRRLADEVAKLVERCRAALSRR